MRSDQGILATMRALTSLSEIDLLYADRYLDRAETLLPQVFAREEYFQLQHDRDALPRAPDALRYAIDKGDFGRVRALAAEAAQEQARLTESKTVLEIADIVYGPRILRVHASTLPLSGLVMHPSKELERERASVVENLRALVNADPEWGAFYSVRVAHYDHLEVVAEPHPGNLVPADQLRGRLLDAVERHDFQEVQRLANTLAAEVQRSVPGRIRAPLRTSDLAQGLAVPFPPEAVSRACDLGLTEETVSAASDLNAYLGCCCGERPSLPEVPLNVPGAAQRCTCGHPCPPSVRPALRENLDLLLLHPFMSSGGSRYLPWFGTETLLVETFRETAPDLATPLLQALGLPRRRGLSRLVIEDAVRTRGARVCTQLDLDPFEFVLTCIPFDVYTRLASQHGWGREHLWTHFDGYQVTRDLKLHALVGGDAHYGGQDDLCAVQRDYSAERITTRLCIVRRQRFLVRQFPDGPTRPV